MGDIVIMKRNMFLLFFLIGLAESALRPPWVDKIRRMENDNKLLLARIEKLEDAQEILNLNNKILNLEKQKIEESNMELIKRVEQLERDSKSRVLVPDRYQELKTEIDEIESELVNVKTDLNDAETDINGMRSELDQVKTDIDDARTDIDDVQERNYAFKYYVSSSVRLGAVKKGAIVNFDSRNYGSGVTNGQYSAPIDGLYQIDFHLHFQDSNSYYAMFQIRKNNTQIQRDALNADNSSSTSDTAKTFYTSIKVNLRKGDKIDMFTN